ncbi:hypothetical protein ACIBI9_63385 [Nonomuraea sp. NPDC050451]|uniref:hypothetical protein n=1 Tax=Nonomuraea sp. NPDC050451 TaxID=3364364 RepID=UPI0037B209C9
MEHSDDVPPVDVVLFRASQGGRAVPVSGGDSVDLTALDSPDEDVLRALLDAALQLAVSADMPADVVRAIAATPVPQLFQRSPWLYEHRVLMFTEDGCTVGGHVLRYRDGLGLLLEDADALA